MRTKWTLSVAAAAAMALSGLAPATGVAMPGMQKGGGAAAQQPPSAGVVTGKVVEVLEGGGYTYLSIEQKSGKVWAAVPGAGIKVGDQVTVDAQALMGGYESPSLKRKFDQVYFGTLRAPAGAEAPAAAAAPAAPAQMPAAPAAAYADAKIKGKVLEVLQVPGYSYLRIKSKEGETWAAVPTAEVAVGSEVGINSPSNMDGFESKALKRKFDRLVFGTLSLPGGKVAQGAK